MASPFNPRFDPFDSSLDDDGLNDEYSRLVYNDDLAFFKAIGAGRPGGMPMPKLISAAEARREGRQRSFKIFQDWNLLREILQRHEQTIQKRWIKKTMEQRRKVLLLAWPGMPPSHRPDFEAFRKDSAQQREAGTRFRDAYTWPDINQEDLLTPRILPLFLSARARTPPDAFAMYDYDATRLGHTSKAVIPPFLNLHTMMFTGRRTPERYGELLAWDEHNGAYDGLLTGSAMHPGQGLYILERQERILAFLVSCCKGILHEIPAASMVSDYPIQLEPPSLSANADGFSSLAVMAAEAPYRPPASLDLSRVASLLSSRVSAAEDHLWALREDPGYFADYLLECKEHCPELLKDIRGQSHTLFQFRRDSVFWARVIGNVITDTCPWRFGPSCPVKRYIYKASRRSALLKFQHYLNQAALGPLGQLKHCVVSSPPLRKYFVREPPESPTSTNIRVRSKPNIKFDKTEQHLIWLLTTLWENNYDLFIAGYTGVVDEL